MYKSDDGVEKIKEKARMALSVSPHQSFSHIVTRIDTLVVT